MATGQIICGTGHRPDRIGGYGEHNFYQLVRLCHKAFEILKPTRVITGGALGFDQALATAAAEANLAYEVFVPFEDFNLRWPLQNRIRLERLINSASEVKLVCEPGYASWKLHRRNEAMVDSSEFVLALYDGQPKGGTYQCIQYARRLRRPMGNLWDRWNRKEF